MKANLKSEALIDLLLETQFVKSLLLPLSLTVPLCLEGPLPSPRVVRSQPEYPANPVLAASAPLLYMIQMMKMKDRMMGSFMDTNLTPRRLNQKHPKLE